MKFLAIFSSLAVATQAFVPSAPITKSAAISQPSIITTNVDIASSTQYISTPSRCPTQLFMGWGPEPEWAPATVKAADSCSSSGNFISVSVDVPASVIEEYKVPGQYVQVKADIADAEGKVLFLAIASPPAKEGESLSSIEFLVKKTDTNGWLTDAAAGTNFAISQVMGGGFPIAEECEGFKYDFPLQNCLLFANGSGIAPIRAAIESGQLKIGKPGMGGRTARLYYGCSTVADMPYISKFQEWEASGVEVVPVISRPEECQGSWTGRTGYVQTCLEEDGVAVPRNSGALLCGVKGMAESVKDILTKAGVFEGRVMTNF